MMPTSVSALESHGDSTCCSRQLVHEFWFFSYMQLSIWWKGWWKWMIFMAENIQISYSCLPCNIVLKRERIHFWEDWPCYWFLRLACLSIEQYYTYFIPGDGCCSWFDIDLKLLFHNFVLCCCWSFNRIVVRQWIACLSMISFAWSLRSWLSSSNAFPVSLITLISSCTCVTNSFWIAPVCSWGFPWLTQNSDRTRASSGSRD